MHPIHHPIEGLTVYPPSYFDPSPVFYDGATHVFATQNGSLVHLTGQPLERTLDPEEVKHFNGTTVPFAFVEKNALSRGQRQFNGRRTPMISRYTSAKKWTVKPDCGSSQTSSMYSPIVAKIIRWII